MFAKTTFQTQFAYHWHTVRHLMDFAAKLPDAEYREDAGYGHGSIHSILFHILRADEGWRRALETGSRQEPLTPELYPDLAALREGYAREQAAWDSYLNGLSVAHIEGKITLTSPRGEATYDLARILQHLIIHGMQHHSEIAALLTRKGHSPGNLDFLFFTG
ncbi:MAG TPA: DinB family protein [Aggregatilineales bacterium]|nr:DinB family protein [Anaerolineales bacterium]HRE47297.1 DinB family protein [Aggregatilineales bacterium]